MSTTIRGRYLGNKKTEPSHVPTGRTITTDAPPDNHGEGSTFSPTDLVAAALSSCIMTVMSIVAERHHIDLTGMRCEIIKEMSVSPRRIGSLSLELHLPSNLSVSDRQLMENTARTCPVHHSLHPDVAQPVTFFYDVG